VDVMRWYRNGMPRGSLRNGSRMDSVETAFSALPLKPARVPFRVYRSCEAEMEAERRLKGLPRISNRASAAEGVPLEARGSRLCCGSVDEGTELIWTYRRP